jgi:hypothetical protein
LDKVLVVLAELLLHQPVPMEDPVRAVRLVLLEFFLQTLPEAELVGCMEEVLLEGLIKIWVLLVQMAL